MVISKLRPLPATTVLFGEGGILESAILSNGYWIKVDGCLA